MRVPGEMHRATAVKWRDGHGLRGNAAPLGAMAGALPATAGYIIVFPYPTAFPYGNGMVLHFYQQQESSTTKTVHKVINKGLKTYV